MKKTLIAFLHLPQQQLLLKIPMQPLVLKVGSTTIQTVNSLKTLKKSLKVQKLDIMLDFMEKLVMTSISARN